MNERSLAAECARRFALLDRGQRLRWMTLLPVGLATAALEAVASALVYGLIGALTSPADVSRQPLVAPLAALVARAGVDSILVAFTLAAAAVYVVKNALLVWAAYYSARVGGETAAGVGSRLVRAYLAAPYIFHVRRSTAELVQNLLSGLPALTSVFSSLSTIATESLVVLALLVVLCRIAPAETVVAMAVLGGALAICLRVTRGVYHRMGAQHFEIGEIVLARVQQALGAIKEVKTFGREGFFHERIAREQETWARLGAKHSALETVPRLLTEAAFALGLLALVIVLHSRAATAGAVLPFVGLYAYAGFRMIPASHRLALHAANLRYELAVSASLCRDLERLERPGVPTPAAREQEAPPVLRGTIRLEHVSYTYDGAAGPILCDIDLEVRPGECVGIVGASGAGKSTLVDVMLGLLEPATGRVTIDGTRVGPVGPGNDEGRTWSHQIGYVPQDPYLMDDTVRRNIAFGIPDPAIDDEALRRAVAAAQLDAVVRSLPQGFETTIGERGVRLSGGERQRVAIARALYDDPGVLVFDEATSSLDSTTERELVHTIDRLRGRTTIVVIAHRLTTVERCDRLVLLGEGRVEATGTYEELWRASPAFQALHRSHHELREPDHRVG